MKLIGTKKELIAMWHAHAEEYKRRYSKKTTQNHLDFVRCQARAEMLYRCATDLEMLTPPRKKRKAKK